MDPDQEEVIGNDRHSAILAKDPESLKELSGSFFENTENEFLDIQKVTCYIVSDKGNVLPFLASDSMIRSGKTWTTIR